MPDIVIWQACGTPLAVLAAWGHAGRPRKQQQGFVVLQSQIFDDVGSGGSVGAFFILNFKKRVARKLLRIVLRHFGLVPSRLNVGKPENPSFS